MTVAVLLITHDGVGAALLDSAIGVYGRSPLPAESHAIPGNCDPDTEYVKVMEIRDRLDDGSGVLVLSDLFGSTPSNLASRMAREARVRVVAGVNLPMLVRVFNYPQLDLDSLARKALEGGRDGVVGDIE